MWRMVRLLRKYGPSWNNQEIRLEKSRNLDAEWGSSHYFSGMIEQQARTEIMVGNNREPRASRKALAIRYALPCWRRWFCSPYSWYSDKKMDEKISRAKSIIQTCVDAPHQFMNEETIHEWQHNPYVYLTTKGKQFPFVALLFRELRPIREELNGWKAFLFGTLGGGGIVGIAWFFAELL